MATVTRFSVVSFAPSNSTMLVVGSCQELGNWNPKQGPKLESSLRENRKPSEPDYWWVDVKMSEDTSGQARKGVVQYKFVQLKHDGEMIWEGSDDGDNRKLDIPPSEATGIPCLLPTAKFKDGSLSEHDHTGRFYQTVKEMKDISLQKIVEGVWLGSCPRTREHISLLKRYGVTVVMNFQTEADCMNNCIGGIGSEEDATAIKKLYDEQQIQYVWLPTFDMSTVGRTLMLPHASYLLAGLRRRGHVVYVHCNAGVGRSVAAVCGFLLFSVGVSMQQMQHVVAKGRPVSYIDAPALLGAEPAYRAMFGPPDEDFQELRNATIENLKCSEVRVYQKAGGGGYQK